MAIISAADDDGEPDAGRAVVDRRDGPMRTRVVVYMAISFSGLLSHLNRERETRAEQLRVYRETGIVMVACRTF